MHRARSADSIVDTIGVNTHLSYTNTVYWRLYKDKIKLALGELDVRYIRDAVVDRTRTDARIQTQRVFELYEDYDIHISAYVYPNFPVADVVAYIKELSPAVIALEGPNEPDYFLARETENWQAITVDLMHELHEALLKDRVTREVTFVAPSLVYEKNAPLQTRYAPLIDYGNIHPYAHPYAPEKNDAVRRKLAAFNTTLPGVPFVATETGYHTTPRADGNVSELVQAKYTLRTIAYHAELGIARTYLYELANSGMSATDREDNFGLLRGDGSHKPAFDALRRFIDVLDDQGEPFEPGSLAYERSGGSDVHELLLQRRDGTFLLVLWYAAASGDADVTQSVQYTFAEPHNLTFYTPLRSEKPVRELADQSHVSLDVPDHLLIIEIH